MSGPAPPVQTMRHRQAEVNGERLHVAEAGSGGPLVLMLHGFPEFWYAWRHHLVDLGRDHRAAAPDTRGVNLSTGPDAVEGYRVEALVEDVRGLVAASGHDRCVLVGHDWGGFVARETAIRHPGLVERPVVVNTAHPGVSDAMLRGGGAQAEASRYMLAFRSPRGEELLRRDDFAGFERAIPAPARAAGRFTEADCAAYREAWGRPGALTRGLNHYRADKTGPMSGGDPPPRALAETVARVPNLVVWGERDPCFVPENLDRLPAVVPDLAVRRCPDDDHRVLPVIGTASSVSGTERRIERWVDPSVRFRRPLRPARPAPASPR